MTLKIAYVPHKREDKDGARWGENTVMRNLIANSALILGIILAIVFFMHWKNHPGEVSK